MRRPYKAWKKSIMVVIFTITSSAMLWGKCIEIEAGGVGAFKTNHFDGGGALLRIGGEICPCHFCQVEFLWIDQKASITDSELTQASGVSSSMGAYTFVDKKVNSIRSTLSEIGILLNYYYEGVGMPCNSCIRWRIGAGGGALYAKTKTNINYDQNSTNTVFSIPLIEDIHTRHLEAASNRSFWTPAAQIFIGGRWQLTELFSVFASANLLFTFSKDLTISSLPLVTSFETPYIQPLFEAGIEASF